MTNIDEKVKVIRNKKFTGKIKNNPDFIFVYWLSNFLNAESLYELSKKYNAQVVLHLTDMAPFTGGCHFTLDCTNYTRTCGNCPGIYSENEHDITHKNLLYKKKYYDLMNVRVVVGSSELKKQVKHSTLLKDKQVFQIPYHVEIPAHSETETRELKNRFGIPAHKKVILVGATQLDQERKGFNYLIKTLSYLNKELPEEVKNNIVFAVVGSNYEDFIKEIPFEYVTFGLLREEELNDMYRLSDVFLNTSIQDIGPYMLIEAMLYKTLVVSYDVGLANDLISDRVNGFVAPNKDFISYGDCMIEAFSLEKAVSDQMKDKAFDHAKEVHEWKNQLDKYKLLFKS
jgi:glycosyltransferase involved in cell wall biosynthesis